MFDPIPIEEFERRTHIRRSSWNFSYGGATKVVSLRDVVHIRNVAVMREDHLRQLLSNVTLIGDESARPYAGMEIKVVSLDPHQARVVQTFVERKKCLGFLEGFTERFKEFCMDGGIAKLGPMVVFGENAAGEEVIALYIPPLLEAENGHVNLLDGIHRNFTTMQVGASICSVIIRGVTIPFPATPMDWDQVKMVDEKPPKDERFFNLDTGLFRNLKFVGFDG